MWIPSTNLTLPRFYRSNLYNSAKHNLSPIFILMKLVLSGWGNHTDSIKIDTIYKNMLVWKSILYIPRAMYPNKYESCHTWIQNIFPSSQWYTVHTLSDKDFIENPQDYLNLYDGIYIWGGNTYRLLKLIKETWFSQIIENFLAHDKPIYWGSAWAIIMGKNINTSEDRNIIKFWLDDCLWFNQCNNSSLACHYTWSSSSDSELTDYVKHFQIPVLALPEWTWVIYDGDNYSIQWNNSAYLFDVDGKKELKLWLYYSWLQ